MQELKEIRKEGKKWVDDPKVHEHERTRNVLVYSTRCNTKGFGWQRVMNLSIE